MSKWLSAGNTAVITGGGGGIGLECARRYAAADMNVVLVDINEEKLTEAQNEISSLQDKAKTITAICDVSDAEAVKALADDVFGQFGEVNCLMNNAGIIAGSGKPWEQPDVLQNIMGINFYGVVHGCQAFIPRMVEQEGRGAVINTASKQGITRPPGSYAYNLSKASIVAYTEAIAHAFTEPEHEHLSAHLLVPAFVYTPMVSAFIPEKPDFAWTAEQTIDHALPRIEKGDFYVICPDNESPWEVDQKRIQWSADDLIKNRPAASRWHADYKQAFEDYMKD